MSDLVPVKRALLSVSDKTGLVEFATILHSEFGVELVSTGGTAKALRDANLPVKDVSQLTGFPEMMDGRLKTLHPRVHGGLLARRDNPEHTYAMQQHGIQPIDLVCVNLYPFEKTAANPDATFEDAIENIDIGGPAMIRAAAKNHRFVLVVTDPLRYDNVVGDLRQHAGSTCGKHRLKMAQQAYAHTADYDAGVARYLAGAIEPDATMPREIRMSLVQKQTLRYGENPHQMAALYTHVSEGEVGIAGCKQLSGKELSYINLLDADAAWNCAMEFSQAAACIVKHATPCGVGAGDTLVDAFTGAYDSDPLAAFGGVVAFNRPVDVATATSLAEGKKFVEVVVAPAYSPAAVDILSTRWKNARLLEVPTTTKLPWAFSSIGGGMLVQQRDTKPAVEFDWKVVSKIQPGKAQLASMKFAWLACKHVKSNAIVIAKGLATVGIGGGQVDRVGAAKIAISKAGDRAGNTVAASDAFFPFDDGPRALLDAGVTAIVQPGGSVRDADSIKLVDDAGAVMVFTGTRHFRH